MKQILCMNWGTAYGAEYVNRLYSMVARNITGDFRFVCYTESRVGIRPEVECYDCPRVDIIPEPYCNYGWRKISLWARELEGLTGEVLFIDLDVVITSSLDQFFEYPGNFCVIRNWTQPEKRIGNTSVYRFRVGSHPYLLETLVGYSADVLAKFPNSQTYISHTVKEMSFWPDQWCRSFKVHCVPKGIRRWFVEPGLPVGTRIVAFPGSPNPHDAAVGRWPSPWYKKIYKHIRPAKWVQENWQ